MNRIANLSDRVERKFVESVDIPDFLSISVKTEEGFKPISQSHKTVEYKVYEIILENGLSLRCADDHIVIQSNGDEIFVKDAIPGITILKTEQGDSRVQSVAKFNHSENMYDFSVDSEAHTYYTDGILSHNTTTMACDILHDMIFKEDYRILIGSYSNALALDFMDRIAYAYTCLPWWLKPPAVVFNKFSIRFDNNSSVSAQTFNPRFGRGKSNSRIVLDELAFGDKQLVSEMMASLIPSISASGENSTTKLNVISTPNGTQGEFYDMWSKAIAGDSTFVPVKVEYDEIPGRTPEFEKQMLMTPGMTRDKFDQEFRCVAGDTLVECLIDDVPVALTIEELYELQTKGDKKNDSIRLNNKKIKIKGASGDFEDFMGVQKTHHERYVHITFENTELKCALDHRIIINGDWKEARYVVPGDFSGDNKVLKASIVEEGIDLFDILESDSHTYLSNGIISHNCMFISSSGTLVNSRIIESIKSVKPYDSYGDLEVYVESIAGRKLAIAVDPSEGIGEDYSAIQVFDVDTMEQVAEYADNMANQTTIVRHLVSIMNYLKSRGASDLYWSYESNGIGSGLGLLLEGVDDPVFNDAMQISDESRISKGKTGMVTTARSKKEACGQFKDLVETGRMTLKSQRLINELKTFVKNGSSFEAQPGNHDDRVMACILIVRMFVELRNYESSVEQKMSNIVELAENEDWSTIIF